jgi:hypothetical protein
MFLRIVNKNFVLKKELTPFSETLVTTCVTRQKTKIHIFTGGGTPTCEALQFSSVL